MKTISIAALLSVGTFITMVVGGVFAFEGRYATHVEVGEVEQLAGSNTLLILYTQLDRAMAERRRLIEAEQPTPQSLLDTIARLCRDIAARGGRC